MNERLEVKVGGNSNFQNDKGKPHIPDNKPYIPDLRKPYIPDKRNYFLEFLNKSSKRSSI